MYEMRKKEVYAKQFSVNDSGNSFYTRMTIEGYSLPQIRHIYHTFAVFKFLIHAKATKGVIGEREDS